MALGRIVIDLFEGIGPFFGSVGELFGDLLPEVVKLFGYLLEGDPIAVGIAAMIVSGLVFIFKSRLAKRKLHPRAPKAKAYSSIVGLLFGLLIFGFAYFVWRINTGPHVELERLAVIAAAIGIPVVVSAYLSFLNHWNGRSQTVPLAILALGFALTVWVSVAEFRVPL